MTDFNKKIGNNLNSIPSANPESLQATNDILLNSDMNIMMIFMVYSIIVQNAHH